MPDEDDEYTEIARRFFAEFLALKVQLDRGELVAPRSWQKERADYAKLTDTLKKSLKEAITEQQHLENQLADLDEENKKLLARVNELTIALGRANERLSGLRKIGNQAREQGQRAGYRFEDLMDEDSARLWRTLMEEIPRPK